ncbi:MAG TPA: hypothetical protein VGJ54_11820 [Streptosporangiaceae bacterium]
MTRPGRMRASLITGIGAWTLLAASALIFGQLNQDQGLHPATPGHPITAALHAVYLAAAHLSTGVLLAGTAPLMASLARAAVRRRAIGDLLRLSLPATASLVFIALLVGVSHVVRHGPHGIGAYWFGLLAVLGLLTGAASVAGPSTVLRRTGAAGRPLHAATLTAALAALSMAIAVLASAANLITVDKWTVPASPLHTPTGAVIGYTAVILAGTATALTTAARGVLATRHHT